MLPVSKDEISKLKYIYRAYQDRNGNFYIEKYPIVYINKKYVYFANGLFDTLSIVPIKKIYENFPKSYDITKNCLCYQYFWKSSYTQEEID